jgi:hypothetical protein
MSVRSKAACQLATTTNPHVFVAAGSLAMLLAALIAYGLSV